MPLYAYKCKNCDYAFEQRQRMVDPPLTKCPNCHTDQLRRVIDRVGVVFKGSGFYVTDSKSKNSAAPAKDKDASATSTSNGSGESKKDESKKPEKSESKGESKATA